jgi:hypothetical protein
MILSIHQPLNISLLTTAPIGWFFNTRKIHLQKINFLLLACRVPIFILDNNVIHCVRLSDILGVEGKIFMSKVEKNEVKDIKGFVDWRDGYIGKPYAYEENVRVIVEKENNNVAYRIVYADAQYNAFTNPQSNDFFSING